MSEPSGPTRRQLLAELLAVGPWGFDELRRELQTTVGDLEDDLRHLERSVHRGAVRLHVEPAACTACGFVFGDRAPRHFHPPSRCPRCKSERITGPRYRLA